MLNSYKIFAGHMIVESDNTKEIKVQLLNFVKDAAEPQVKNFILHGTVMENIKEKDITIINEQFEKAYGEDLVNMLFEAGGFKDRAKAVARTTGTIVAAHNLYTVIPWAIYRKIKSRNDSCTKKCGTFQLNTIRRQLCMAKCNLIRRKSELAAAQKTKNKKEIDKKVKSATKAQNKLKSIQNAIKSAGVKS